MFKVASWNINSINTRLDFLIDWLESNQIDILFLQEIKCDDKKFPFSKLENAGYNCICSLEKAKNGVGIISKHRLTKTNEFLKDKEQNINDYQARYIEAMVNINNKDISVASVYVPAGGWGNVNFLKDSDQQKFNYKIDFLRRLYRRIMTDERPQIIGGDFNIAPNLSDVYTPSLKNNVCVSEKERNIFKEFEKLGYINSLNKIDLKTSPFTWWSYQGGSFEKDHGLRLDHILLDECFDCSIVDGAIDINSRKADRPSDHAPVILELELV